MSQKVIYSARVHMTKESILALSLAQARVFGGAQRLARVVISALLVFSGVVLSARSASAVILVFLGCVLLSLMNHPAQRRANKIDSLVSQSDLGYPSSTYEFGRSKLSVYDEPGHKLLSEHDLSAIKAIYTDGQNYFVFPSKWGGYCIPISNIAPPNESDFAQFLTSSTGLPLRDNKSPFSHLLTKVRASRGGR